MWVTSLCWHTCLKAGFFFNIKMNQVIEIIQANGLKAEIIKAKYESGEICYGARYSRNGYYWGFAPFGIRTLTELKTYCKKRFEKAVHSDIDEQSFLVNGYCYLKNITKAWEEE